VWCAVGFEAGDFGCSVVRGLRSFLCLVFMLYWLKIFLNSFELASRLGYVKLCVQ